MKNKTSVLILLMISIIILLVSIIVFVNVQTIKAPDATITIEIIDVNSEEATVETIMDIYNPNDFEIISKNLKIVTTTIDGEEIASTTTKGGAIPPHKNSTFTTISKVNYNGQDPETLKSVVKGEIGAKIIFFEKVIPFSINIITSVGELIDNLVSPEINTQISFGEIDKNNINISFSTDIYNPNNLNVSLKNTSVEIKDENNEIIGFYALPDLIIVAKDNTSINQMFNLDLDFLNAKKLAVYVKSNVIGHIAGYAKIIPINLKTVIINPDLEDILPSDKPMECNLRGDYHASLSGLVGEISIEFDNPNNLELTAKDIILNVNRVDKNTKTQVANVTIENGIIKPENTTTLYGEVVIPYSKLFIPPIGGRIIPDGLELEIKAKISIQGLNNYLWVGVSAYQDFHLFIK